MYVFIQEEYHLHLPFVGSKSIQTDALNAYNQVILAYSILPVKP